MKRKMISRFLIFAATGIALYIFLQFLIHSTNSIWVLVGAILAGILMIPLIVFLLYLLFGGSKGVVFSVSKFVYQLSRMSVKKVYYGAKRTKFRTTHDLVEERQEGDRLTEEFYREKFQPAILKMEKQRRRKILMLLLTIIPAAGIFGVVYYFSCFHFRKSIAILYYADWIFLSFYVFFYIRTIAYLRGFITNKFQQEIILPLLKFINKDLKYSPHEGMKINEITACSVLSGFIIPGQYSRNLVEGSVDHVDFRIAEVFLGNQKQYFNSFSGVLFIAKFNKKIISRTICRNDGKPFAEESLLKKITLENLEFNSYFETFTGDEQEARYILSPGMMERLLSVQASLSKPCFVVFEKNTIFIGMANFFHLNVYHSINGYQFVENYYQIFRLFNDIIRELHLNVHIPADQQKKEPLGLGFLGII